MTVQVEFLGMPRQYAQCDSIQVAAGTLAEVLEGVAREVPDVARHCFNGAALRAGYLACVNGARFTADSDRSLQAGDTLQILSADAGGH